MKIRESFNLNEIKNLVFDEKTKAVSFVYNNKKVTGKLIFFYKGENILVIEKEIKWCG